MKFQTIVTIVGWTLVALVVVFAFIQLGPKPEKEIEYRTTIAPVQPPDREVVNYVIRFKRTKEFTKNFGTKEQAEEYACIMEEYGFQTRYREMEWKPIVDTFPNNRPKEPTVWHIIYCKTDDWQHINVNNKHVANLLYLKLLEFGCTVEMN